MDHRHGRERIIRRAIGDAHAQLDHHGIIQQTVADHLLHEDKVAGVEDFQFRSHAKALHFSGHGAQRTGRVGHHIIGFGEVHRAAIERANLRQQFLHMEKSLHRADHVSAGRIEREGIFARAKDDIAAHTGGQVDHDVRVAGAYPLHHFAVEPDVPAALTRFGITHMDMGNCGPCARRFNRGIGDLCGGDGQSGMLICGGARAGHGAGDKRFKIHGISSYPDPQLSS